MSKIFTRYCVKEFLFIKILHLINFKDPDIYDIEINVLNFFIYIYNRHLIYAKIVSIFYVVFVKFQI